MCTGKLLGAELGLTIHSNTQCFKGSGLHQDVVAWAEKGDSQWCLQI